MVTAIKVLVAFILLAWCAVVSGKRAIVTLLSGMPTNAERYTRLLHFFVYSLRNAGYDGEILVMHVENFPIDITKLSQRLNVKTKLVEQINVENSEAGNPHYASMLTKLHLWNLLEYEQVMYYDCDFIFQHNPASAFRECSWSKLCATVDTGIHTINRSIKPGTYFNGGFLVLRPDKGTYKYLLSNLHLAQNKYFVEQDLLNQIYKDSWGRLDQKYNLMHCYKLSDIPVDVVAIHEKMWILKESFTQTKYVWNSSKMNIAYPIKELLTNGQHHNAKSSVKSTPGTVTDTITLPNTALQALPVPLTPQQHLKHAHVLKRPRGENAPSHYNNPEAYLAAHTSALNTNTIAIPPSIVGNTKATEIYRNHVKNQIQSKQLESLRSTSRNRIKPQRSPHMEASINRAPSQNKFERKTAPAAKRYV